MLAHVRDASLRLWHPAAPFITEEIWQLLAGAAPERGLTAPAAAAESVMIADWPKAEPRRHDAEIELRFARFQEVLRGLREIRSRQNIPPKTPIRFSARCDAETADLLQPMATYFASMANAQGTVWGPQAAPPATHAQINLKDLELFVDLEGLIDLDAEMARLEKERGRLQGLIAGKEKKLSNADFLARAPADVVEKERAALDDVRSQLASIEQSLTEFRRRKR